MSVGWEWLWRERRKKRYSDAIHGEVSRGLGCYSTQFWRLLDTDWLRFWCSVPQNCVPLLAWSVNLQEWLRAERPNLRNHQKVKLEGLCPTIYTSMIILTNGLRKKNNNQKIPEYYHRSLILRWTRLEIKTKLKQNKRFHQQQKTSMRSEWI